ncbi:two-component sensor histidine kinase [Paenibacillaceae bacterium]|nr:two-component sensor histidine kinase [Paenibacillaceae bacterium]
MVIFLMDMILITRRGDVLENWLQKLKPASLKNRLFLAFLLLIILPFSVLQIRNHVEVKTLYEKRISEQNQYQLNHMKQTMEQIKSDMLLTSLQIEKERAILDVLPALEQNIESEMREAINELFIRIKGGLYPGGESLNYVLSDLKGRLYTSYEEFPEESYSQFMGEGQVSKLLETKESFLWEYNNAYDMLDTNTPVIALYTLFMDANQEPIGLLRVSFDYRQWLKKNIGQFLIQNNYYLLDHNGEIRYQSAPNGTLTANIGSIVNEQNLRRGPGYVVDKSTSTIINSSRITSMNWNIVSQFPLEVFFGDIRAMNRQFFVTFFVFTILFIVITLFILSAIISPLMLMRRNMSNIIEKNFKTRIPTDRYKGEILDIAVSFNNMTEDLNKMVARLKMEERQKEAIRFQMLLQQMNPHFLINTLNTLKWNVLSRGDEASADICIALGKLLETSLNSDVDLIYLKDELELVEAYATIQNFRFDHRFEVNYLYEEEFKFALVPKLSLQPLVENAIQHGLANVKVGGIITIRIYEQARSMIVEIEDNGCGLAAVKKDLNRKRKPIGLKNIKERLSLLYKENAKLELLGLEHGTLVRMQIPLLIAKPYE